MNLASFHNKLLPDFKEFGKDANQIQKSKLNTTPFLKWLLSETSIVKRALNEKALKIFVNNILTKEGYTFQKNVVHFPYMTDFLVEYS